MHNKEIMQIEPYSSIKIDCFQNLLMTLLNSKGIDPCIFGCVWPWFFFKKRNSNNILYQYFVSTDALKKLSGFQLMESDIKNDLIKTLIGAVKNNAIIINIDQYYLTHHYPDVYNVSHGVHSLLLLKYDIEKLAFLGIGVFPEYKGWMDENEIAQGMLSNYISSIDLLKYYWLDKIDNWIAPQKDDIDNQFFSNLYKTDKYDGYETIEISDIYKMFSDMHARGRDSFIELFKSMSNDRWIWEIERPGNVLSAYLQSEYYSPILLAEQRKKAVSYIEEINKYLVLSLRKIYKYILINNYNIFKDGLNYLEMSWNKSRQLKLWLQSMTKA